MAEERRISIHIAGSTVYKLLLLSAVVAVSVVFMWYTYEVIHQLRSEAQEKVRSYVRLWGRAVDQETPSSETQLIFDEIISQANFPIVVASAEREPNFWRNIPGIPDSDRSPEAIAKVRSIMERMKREHGEVEIVFGSTSDSAGVNTRGVNYFYHGDSELIENLKIAPYIQIAMVALVLSIGFVGFTNIKRSDERHIWVGMAKETAHQLGTPISSLMGWLEIMRSRAAECFSADSERRDMFESTLDAMEVDIQRLRQVANRFGKIGSAPEMSEGNLNEMIEDTVTYYRKRLPFGGDGAQLKFHAGNVPTTVFNPELLSWAIENLIKNALEAVDPREGSISIESAVSPDGRRVLITVTDNGRGIPLGQQRRIFRPGFSSKKRGWGLGLTLTRRIIEEYHHGKIALVRSAPGETVFQITLPLDGVRAGA